MFKTLSLLAALLLTSCVEVGTGSPSEPQSSGNLLPPIGGGASNNDDDSDDDSTEDDNDGDDTPDDEGDDDVADDDDTTPVGDDDDDNTTPAPVTTGDVSWWYQSEDEIIYEEMIAFGWSWAWQQAGDPNCEDCYVLLAVGEDTNDLSGGSPLPPELNDLPEGTVVSFDVWMTSSGSDEVWSCQNGAPSGQLRVWWGNVEQAVCTDDWGAGCSRVVEMGSGNCAAF